MAGTVGLTLWSPSVGQERPLQEEPSSHRSYPSASGPSVDRLLGEMAGSGGIQGLLDY